MPECRDLTRRVLNAKFMQGLQADHASNDSAASTFTQVDPARPSENDYACYRGVDGLEPPAILNSGDSFL